MSQDKEDTRHTVGSIDETADGYPICQWCGGAITVKDDLVLAAEETGVPTQIAPIGYTAPRTFTAYHRECHAEFSDEPQIQPASAKPTLQTPENAAILGVTILIILIVLVFVVLPR